MFPHDCSWSERRRSRRQGEMEGHDWLVLTVTLQILHDRKNNNNNNMKHLHHASVVSLRVQIVRLLLAPPGGHESPLTLATALSSEYFYLTVKYFEYFHLVLDTFDFSLRFACLIAGSLFDITSCPPKICWIKVNDYSII